MIGYLIKRPIAVFTISSAIIFLGIIAAWRLPTSLMPNVDIPEITVQISYPNYSAREIENNIVRPLRNSLLQVAHLKDIQSETNDESAIIKLIFNYGTKIHYAFIETNEKIDATVNYLPKDLSRPKVIKASATDIPVLNLVVLSKNTKNENYLQLGSFARQVIKKRIEQLPEVGIADMSGAPKPEIVIQPKTALLQQTGITTEMITQTLKENNIETGNFIIQNGIYQYKFKFNNKLNSIEDIKKLHLLHQGKLFTIGNLCDVYKKAQKRLGWVNYNGNKAIVFSVIKQQDAKISDLKQKLHKLITQFKTDYPKLEFVTLNDQSKLLQVSLSNLVSSLIIGTVLAILILFFFIRNYKIPFIIAISIPSSLLISLLLLYILHISINIISLSGLVLGVGLMIDNAIIVIDNIAQKSQNNNLFDAVVKGTNEVISPLISSVLTTVSVFVPLVFLSGIAGALFYDQAISVSVGLFASLLVSILLIPVIYYMLQRNAPNNKHIEKNIIENYYGKSYNFIFKRKISIVIVAILGLMLLGLNMIISKQKLPKLTQTETLISIDWNKAINLEQNQLLIDSIIKQIPNTQTYLAYIGKQDFNLNKENQLDQNQSEVYIKCASNDALVAFKKKFSQHKPTYAKISFSPAKNVFNYIFGSNKKDNEYKIYPKGQLELPVIDSLIEFKNKYSFHSLNVPTQPIIQIKIIQERLLLYDVPYNRLTNQLQAIFHQNFIDQLKSEKEFMPIQLSYHATDIFQEINKFQIRNKNGEQIPAKWLMKIRKTQQYKSILADRKGEYVSFNSKNTEIQPKKIVEINRKSNFFINSNQNNNTIGNELWLTILISIVLLYLIMAAQFESFWQPLIILLEIPIDIGFAFLFLFIFGASINIMSLIGVIVMSGIVINDSILKIHTINLLRKTGLDIDNAIHQAGILRVKPILMTSLTTILALLPFIFMSGLGAELQRPLALVVIGGLFFGTFISLFFVPLAYRSFDKLFIKTKS